MMIEEAVGRPTVNGATEVEWILDSALSLPAGIDNSVWMMEDPLTSNTRSFYVYVDNFKLRDGSVNPITFTINGAWRDDAAGLDTTETNPIFFAAQLYSRYRFGTTVGRALATNTGEPTDITNALGGRATFTSTGGMGTTQTALVTLTYNPATDTITLT